MDIKERIDALTEAEAKAALLLILEYAARETSCDDCMLMYDDICDCETSYCPNNFLEWALKDARK